MFEIKDAAGLNLYRWDVSSVNGYVNGEAIAAAPIIHTYSPNPLAVMTLLAMKKTDGQIGSSAHGGPYTISRFLTVQKLNQDLLQDDLKSYFSITVKPHYAIWPKMPDHGASQNCNTHVFHNDKPLYPYTKGAINVHAHDKLVSPDYNMNELKNTLDKSRKGEFQKSLFFTSYVVDNINKQILITEHCLLIEAEYDALANRLKRLNATSSFSDLMSALTENPSEGISAAAQKFNQADSSEELVKNMIGDISISSASTVSASPAITPTTAAPDDDNNNAPSEQFDPEKNTKLVQNDIDALNDAITLAASTTEYDDAAQLIVTTIQELPPHERSANQNEIVAIQKTVQTIVTTKNNTEYNAAVSDLFTQCAQLKPSFFRNIILPVLGIFLGIALILTGVGLLVHSAGASSVFSFELAKVGGELVVGGLGILSIGIGVYAAKKNVTHFNYYGKSKKAANTIETTARENFKFKT